MTDRVCVRGCAVRGVHFAACPDFGDDGPGLCDGCVPAEGRDGSWLCSRCYFRLRRMISEAPDIVGYLRSKADPSKAMVYDRIIVSGSKPDNSEPVDPLLTNASGDIIRVLRDWAELADGTNSGYRLEPGAGADLAHDVAERFVRVLLTVPEKQKTSPFHDIVSGELAEEMYDAVLIRHIAPPDEWSPNEYWSVADAASRWPFDDKPRRATVPCPDCDTKSIRIYPPRRRGGAFHYVCEEAGCGWEIGSDADDGLWGDVFATVPPKKWEVTVRALCSPCVAGRHDECTGCECREHTPTDEGTNDEH